MKSEMGETERALRALTCEGCKQGVNVVWLDGMFIHCAPLGTPCTSKHAELLPLFNAGMEQARIEQDERWVDAMGWTDLVHNGPYTQSDRENYVKLLVDSVTYNMHEEAPPEQIANAVAGAYAAAADEAGRVQVLPPGAAQRTIRDTILDIKKRILALTPADARQAQSWRCFFCDEVFTDKNLAEEHFGSDEHEVSIPACIDPLRTDEKKRHGEVHAMRQEIKRVEGERDEFEIDSDNLHVMRNELERLFGDGVTTAHHAWLRLEAAQNLAEAYREKLDTQPAARN